MTALHILAVEPYYGGSHRAFLEGVVRHSQHRWTIISGVAKHWKWRMRVAPLSLAQAASKSVNESLPPDLIFCSDMLDLAAWLGLVRRIDKGQSEWIDAPVVTYFHENQWTYPRAPRARVDFHYGYTNLLTAIASTACFFNSAFHRDSFIASSESFVSRMPDSKSNHDFDSLRGKCRVIPPGFNPPNMSPANKPLSGPVNIGWVSRWEHDKRPDQFFALLKMLDKRAIDFRLVLLGPRPDDCEELAMIRQQFGSRIIVDQFAESKQQYWQHLQQTDIVVSTADHEFFGIAVCEAIWAGAAPVLPNRLSYPELVTADSLYDSLEDAAAMIASMADASTREQNAKSARTSVSKYQMEKMVSQLDAALEDSISV